MSASRLRDQIRSVVEQVLEDLKREGITPASEASCSAASSVDSACSAPASVTSPAAKAKAPQGPSSSLTASRPSLLPPQPPAEKKVAIGSDHGGFKLKKLLKEELKELGYHPVDCGTHDESSCDYPDFAWKVGTEVREGRCHLGIMIDGAGIGSAMALNKMAGIRAATVHSEATAINSREHNDANVLVLGSMQMHSGHARRLCRIWMKTPHAGGRHARRMDKINALDKSRP